MRQSTLHAAVLNRNIAAIELLLERGGDVNTSISVGEYGTALQAVAVAPEGITWEREEESPESVVIAKLLLDHGADVNAQGGCYGSALQAAAANKNYELAELFLDRDADINLAESSQYGTVLHAAIIRQDIRRHEPARAE